MAKTPKQTGSKKLIQKTETTSDKPRKLKPPRYQSFKLQKRIKPGAPLPTAFRLLKTAFGTLKQHWKLFLGISLVYGLLNVLLVQGFSVASDLGQAKQTLDQALGGNVKQLANGFSLFMYLLGTSGSNLSPTAGAYQFLLTLVVSLALIWALRQVYAGVKTRVRDGFYKGMYPLIPFMLVLLVIGLEFIPFVAGSFLYTTVMSNGIAVGVAEQILWGTVFFFLAILTIYMLCSSVFALYIVCLPDMTPLRALRSARELVRYRRFAVVRKFLFLPIALFILAGLVIIPLILFATPVAPWAFFLISMLLLAIIHSYMYGFYRSLL